MSKFPLAVKSTLDKVIKELADENALEFLDLDGAALFADVFESKLNAVAWSMVNMVEAPMAPMWHIEFEVGGKTSEDPAQYISMDIASLIMEKFSVRQEFEVRDYSGASPPTARLGDLIIKLVGMTPSQFERTASLRLVHIEAAAFEV